MRNVTRMGLVIAISCYGLLFSLPSMALLAGSGAVHPVHGDSKVYESYVDTNDCKNDKSSSTSFTGGTAFGFKAYVGNTNATLNKTKPMELKCDSGYVMVNMTSETSGAVGEAVGFGGGTVTNNGTAVCCPIKYRWVTPQVKA